MLGSTVLLFWDQVLTYVEIRAPGLDFRIPALNMLCGENPEAVCEELANAPPINLVEEVDDNPAAAETFVASLIQLHSEESATQVTKIAPRKRLLCDILRCTPRVLPASIIDIKIRLVANFKVCKGDSSIGDCRITESFDNGLGFEIHSSQVVISHVDPPYHMRA